MDKDSGLIHSVETTAANVHDLSPAAELLHGEEEVVYADAGYQGIEKRPEMETQDPYLPGCHETKETLYFTQYGGWTIR